MDRIGNIAVNRTIGKVLYTAAIGKYLLLTLYPLKK